MLNEIINQSSALILFLVIVFVVYIFSKYEPKMRLKIAELEALQIVQRLEQDMQNCRNLDQLDRLDDFIPKIIDEIRKKVHDTDKYATRLFIAYNNRRFEIINVEHPGIEQQYIPYLSNY